MTDDQLERAIDFLIKSQARHDTRMQQLAEQTAEQQARTDEQLRQLGERIDGFADTQRRIMQVMTETLEAQSQINKDLCAADRTLMASDESLRASLRASDESLHTAMTELVERQAQTEATVDRLSQKVEALAEQAAGTDRRLEALIKIVEEGRGGGR